MTKGTKKSQAPHSSRQNDEDDESSGMTPIAPLGKGALRILPLGGLGEIGMNCMVLEYDDEIVVVDCGLMFSDLDHFGVEFVIPDFRYLMDRKDKVKAILITHGHEDHIGALPFAIKSGINVPIYASNFASLMIRERLREYGFLDQVDLRPFKMGDVIKFKHFEVETVSVNHSIVDAAALLIKTPVGRVVHTGDFKMDPTPFYGSRLDEGVFARAGDEGVALLLSDSTNVERHKHTISENVIYQSFEQLFKTAEGLTVVSMFASNVARMGQIFELAGKMGKKVALSGRSMETVSQLGQEAGYLRYASSVLIGLDDIKHHARQNVIVLSTGSQGEARAALLRMAQGEHKQIKLQKGDLVLMSSKFIPGNEKPIGRLINQLFKQGADVLYESVHEIHTSGHATRPELKKMLELTRPKFFIPIHGEYRHLVHHAKLGREVGIPEARVVTAVNGDIIEMTREDCKVIQHIDEPRVLVEGREGNDVSRLVLKDRRQMGEKGVVFSLMVRNRESGRIISGPEILSRGLASEQVESWLIEEAKRQVQDIVADYEAELNDDGTGAPFDLQEEIRVELRRFFNANLGKKPTVLPIILDL